MDEKIGIKEALKLTESGRKKRKRCLKILRDAKSRRRFVGESPCRSRPQKDSQNPLKCCSREAIYSKKPKKRAFRSGWVIRAPESHLTRTRTRGVHQLGSRSAPKSAKCRCVSHVRAPCTSHSRSGCRPPIAARHVAWRYPR